MSDIYQRNKPYASATNVRGGYNTPLSAVDEMAFRQWLAQNNVPFNPDAAVTDYDMRGFWLALQRGDPRATTAVDLNDKQLHYPDIWKTPYHASFSQDSQYAGPTAPQWNERDQLVSPGGRILSDPNAAVPNPLTQPPQRASSRLADIEP
jgi:hypothetical protein